MNRFGVGDFCSRNDLVDLEVTLGTLRAAHTVGFVGECDVHRIGVRLAVHSDRLNSHFATGANDAERYLATIGNQNLLKHGYTVKGSRLVDRTCGNKCSTYSIGSILASRRQAVSTHRRHRTDAIQSAWVDAEHWLAKVDRVLVVDQDLDDLSAALGGDLVEDLHRFDNADDSVF